LLIFAALARCDVLFRRRGMFGAVAVSSIVAIDIAKYAVGT
jgi:hypothetical protein